MKIYKLTLYFNGKFMKIDYLNEKDFQHYCDLKRDWNKHLDKTKPYQWHTDIEIYDEDGNLLKACSEEEYFDEKCSNT